jgi:hypothetical protein
MSPGATWNAVLSVAGRQFLAAARTTRGRKLSATQLVGWVSTDTR